MNHTDHQAQGQSKQEASEQFLAEHLQINSAQEQRAANRDYHENITNHFNDIGMLMLLLPEDELDQQSIKSGRHFGYRFGQDFNLNIRTKVIALKQQHHWTERNVKNLLATGGISVNRRTEEVRLYQDICTYIFGWVAIAIMSAYYLLFILIIASATHTAAWKQMLAQLIIAGLCMGTFWLFNWRIIAPYRLLQRTKIVSLKT